MPPPTPKISCVFPDLSLRCMCVPGIRCFIAPAPGVAFARQRRHLSNPSMIVSCLNWCVFAPPSQRVFDADRDIARLGPRQSEAERRLGECLAAYMTSKVYHGSKSIHSQFTPHVALEVVGRGNRLRTRRPFPSNECVVSQQLSTLPDTYPLMDKLVKHL